MNIWSAQAYHSWSKGMERANNWPLRWGKEENGPEPAPLGADPVRYANVGAQCCHMHNKELHLFCSSYMLDGERGRGWWRELVNTGHGRIL